MGTSSVAVSPPRISTVLETAPPLPRTTTVWLPGVSPGTVIGVSPTGLSSMITFAPAGSDVTRSLPAATSAVHSICFVTC